MEYGLLGFCEKEFSLIQTSKFLYFSFISEKNCNKIPNKCKFNFASLKSKINLRLPFIEYFKLSCDSLKEKNNPSVKNLKIKIEKLLNWFPLTMDTKYFLLSFYN